MEKKKTYIIAIIDLFPDAYHFADIFEEEWRYTWLTGGPYPYNDYDSVIAKADNLFWALNLIAETQEQWVEKGIYDVRVYDNDHSCVYKAHEKLPKE